MSATNTELLDAAAAGRAADVRRLLTQGASVEARDSNQRTPLLLAALGDHVEAAKVLVAAGANPNAKDDRSDTAFLVTGVTGSVPMLEALLPAKPDTSIRNRFGGVSVIPASERGHADYVREVLRQTDINVNHVNDLGWTALLEAVLLGDGGKSHQQVVQTLLDNGADPSIADKEGVTALTHAENRGQDEVAAIIRAH